MKEYRIETRKVNGSEDLMNDYAKDGWEVKAIAPNNGMGFGLVIVFEREVK